ncbi:MAG: adenylate/guanylate cyclase domain-containing protein [Chloroflexi bacterium]|nr:adenylate/guanylate cyclase domain-containing protein [Chloroflexota bacterium]
MFSYLKSLLRKGTRKQRRLRNHSLILLSLGVVFGLIVFSIQPFSSFNWRLKDSLFNSRAPTPDIVIVAIDDETLQTYGRLGDWSRSLHAQAIDNLKAAQAEVIGFDVLFAEPAEGDTDLEAAISDAENVIMPVVGTGLLKTKGEVVFNDFVTPTTAFSSVPAALGHVNVLVDGDGTVRRLPVIASDVSGGTYSSFSTAIVSVARGEPPPDIPTDSSRGMRINYVGGPGSFPRISYKDVITGDFDPRLVRGKIVLIGTTAVGSGDLFSTPAPGGQMYGVEVHANAIDTIITGKFVADSGGGITLLAILLTAAVCGVFLPRLTLRRSGLLTAALLGAFIGAVIVCFGKGYMLDIIYTPIALALFFVGVVLCRVTAEMADRQEVTGLFGKYVSPQVAGAIIAMADKDELTLTGEKREVTVLFADMRGFTKLSSGLEPGKVVDILNTYFSVIIDCINANGGMVNKFAGDNIMAIWNAPQSQPEHAFLAVKAALESQKAIDELNRKSGHVSPVEFGIGINTGEATAGSIGSKGRAEYSVIGDTVNLASRICGAAPGGRVWIGWQSYKKVKENVVASQLEPQHFKGKEEAFAVYEVRALV